MIKGSWKTSAAGAIGAALTVLGDVEKFFQGTIQLTDLPLSGGIIALAVGLFFARDARKKDDGDSAN